MARTTTPKKSRAPRRSAEQIARDDLAMTESLLAKVEERIKRLKWDLFAAEEKLDDLQTMRDYQAAHPLLAQEALPVGGDATA